MRKLPGSSGQYAAAVTLTAVRGVTFWMHVLLVLQELPVGMPTAG
jgi:hypothetical protein